MKRLWLFLLAVVALIVVIGGVKGYGVYKAVQGFAAQGKPKFTVSTAKAGYQEWQPNLAAVGSLRAERGADLSSEVDGIVDSIEFQSGDDVKAGQLLLRLRSADEVAHLEALEAAAALAQTTYTRDQAQFEAQAVSQAVLDTDAANLRSAKAQAAQQRALLNKKYVRAPFAGHLGVRAVDVGQYLASGTKIVTLQHLDLMYVDFYLPQQQLGQIKVGQKVRAGTDAFPGQHFAGEIAAVDPQVNVDTRNVQVRAALKNPEHRLLPGMFASIEIEVGGTQRYITLPQTAVSYNPYGATVFVAAPGGTEQPKVGSNSGASAKAAPTSGASGGELVAKQVFVVTGATRGDQVAILQGIKEGDEVVTSGQLKLKNGALITVNNAVQPANDVNPKPQEE